LTFVPGETSRTFRVDILSDSIDEGNETVQLELSNPNGAIIDQPNPIVLTIVDSNGPPQVFFNRSVSSAPERAGTVSVAIELSSPSELNVRVPYTVGGTAGLGDHSLRNGTLILPPGTTSARLRIDLVNDTLDEGSETIIIRMGTPTHAALADPRVHTLTILDNDPRVVLNPITSPVAESVGPLSATLSLSRAPTLPVRVPFTVSGTTDNRDHNLTDGEVLFAVGQTTAQVDFAILDDLREEVFTETLTISLGTPTDGRLGSPATQTIFVQDNDVAGVSLSTTSLNLTEASGPSRSLSYTVVLDTEPEADVTVNLNVISGQPQVLLSANSLTFTPANWNVAQTVVVTALDDKVDEDISDNTITVTHELLSFDPFYDESTAAFTVADVTATIADNDTADLVVGTVVGSVDEANSNAAVYEISLGSRPVADVIVDVRPLIDVSQQVIVDPVQITFTADLEDDWETPRTVTIVAFDDAIDETNPHTGTINHELTSADPKYNDGTTPFTVDSAFVQISDNDTAGVTVSAVSGDLDEANAAATVTYTLVLESQPLDNVTISLAPDAEITAAPTAVTFTPATWDVTQTVTLTVVDDAIDEDGDGDVTPHTGTISHTLASSDPNYAAATAPFTVADTTVTISDNDTAGVTVTPLNVSLNEATPAATVTYTLELDSRPVAPVTVTLNISDGQTTASPTSVTFTEIGDDWRTPQTVTVTVVDDFVDEPDTHTGTISHTLASSDPNYAAGAFAIDDTTVTISDNDTAGVTVTPLNVSLNEATPAATTTYTLVLDSQPVAPVTVALNISDGQTTASPASVTFTEIGDDWRTPQTVTVTVVDDFVDEPDTHTGTISHTLASSDPNYAAGAFAIDDTTVTIGDNDTAGVTMSAVSGDLDEADDTATVTYTLVLDSQPVAPVTVTLGVDGDQLQIPAPASLSFDAGNWNITQTVTLTVIDDDIDEGGVYTTPVTHTVASADPNYAGLSVADTTVSINDNDVAGLAFGVPSNPLNEATAATTETYTVTLTSEPTAPVTVTLAVDSAQLAPPSPPSLTFDSANWNIAQIVTVTVQDDDIDEPDSYTTPVTHTIASADPFYDGSSDNQTITIEDDDTAGVTVSAVSGTLDEANATATVTYTLVLESQPLDNVTISLAPDAEITAAPTTVTFTPATWDVTRTVTLTVVDDAIDEDGDGDVTPHTGTISHTLASSDPNYAAATAPFTVADTTVTISDNDTAGVTVSAVSGNLDEDTPATTVTYTLVLDSEPVAPVTVTPNISDGQTTVSPTSVTFTTADWLTPTTVVVTVVDDFVDEPDPHTGTISHTLASSDPNYAAGAFAIADTTVTISDNDTAGVTVSAVNGSLDEDTPAATVTYTVQLASRPTASVTITPTADLQITTSPSSLTFAPDPLTWNEPQTVTLTVVDDPDIEPSPHTGTISHTQASADPNYAALSIADATVDIIDNDVAGVNLTPASLTITEGETRTYTVTLSSRPTAPVTVTFSAPPDLNLTPVTMFFDRNTWDTPQTRDVSVSDDDVAEATQTELIGRSFSSAGDSNYNFTGSDITVTIVDDDTAGLAIGAPSANLDEANPAVTINYTVTLTSEPVDPVTVNLASDSQVTLLSAASLNFDAGNWDTPQTVTVQVVNDAVDEVNSHTGLITHTTASADSFYVGLSETQTLTIADDDTAGLILGVPSATLNEANVAATVNYTVTLASEPVEPVTVTLTSDSQVTLVSAASLNFDAGNWDSPQTVTVQVVADGVDEADPHTGVITHTTASADPLYAGLSETQTLTITEPGIAIGGVSGTLDEAAPATTVTYTVRLTSEPTAAVTVDLFFDAQVTSAATNLLFTTGTWDITQTVTLEVVDDAIDEDGDGNATRHTGTVTHTLSSLDPNYNSPAPFTVPNTTVSIGDNDTAGLQILSSPVPRQTGEGGGATITVSVVLESQPTDPVTVPFGVSDATEATLAPNSLIFNAGNWDSPQIVTVSGVDDLDPDGHINYNILISPTISLDPNYNAIDPADLAAENLDNEDIAIGFSSDSVTRIEGAAGASANYNFIVNLSRTSLQTVTVDYETVSLTATPGADYTPVTGTLTFVPGDTSERITVVVNGDDIDEPDETFEVRLSNPVSLAGDPLNLVTDTATGTIRDDDATTVRFSQTDYTVGEADGTATVTITLSSALTSTVSVTFITLSPPMGTATPGVDYVSISQVVTFVAGDVEQTVTITINDDSDSEGNETVEMALAIPSSVAIGTPDAATLTITDDDP
jgi:hypothetical protein